MSTDEGKKYNSADSIFISYEICASYLEKSRVPDDKCPICGNTSISTFPILPTEEFTFD
jgi:rubrerythrin